MLYDRVLIAVFHKMIHEKAIEKKLFKLLVTWPTGLRRPRSEMKALKQRKTQLLAYLNKRKTCTSNNVFNSEVYTFFKWDVSIDFLHRIRPRVRPSLRVEVFHKIIQ